MKEHLIRRITTLKTDSNRNRWSPITCNRAPHKPFLLLSVIDHFAQGLIPENFIRPSFDLVDTFNTYWQAIMPPGKRSTMAYPFPRLQNDGIFQLIPAPGFEGKNNIESISSMKRLREVCAGAKLDYELFIAFCQTETREQLRAAIIQKYFAREIQSSVLECGIVNVKAYEYSRNILSANEKMSTWSPDPETDKPDRNRRIRDQGFRKAIITLYEHRCALCGIRMLTPEGHTIVEAAHVIPWSESHDDRPTNGMSLCRLCHWSFDEGLMSVGEEYEVMVSKRVTAEKNFPGHILTLTGRTIFRPGDQSFWPGQENLEYHREKRFLKSGTRIKNV